MRAGLPPIVVNLNSSTSELKLLRVLQTLVTLSGKDAGKMVISVLLFFPCACIVRRRGLDTLACFVINVTFDYLLSRLLRCAEGAIVWCVVVSFPVLCAPLDMTCRSLARHAALRVNPTS